MKLTTLITLTSIISISAFAEICLSLKDPIKQINGYKLSSPANSACYTKGSTAIRYNQRYKDYLQLNAQHEGVLLHTVAELRGVLESDFNDNYTLDMATASFYKWEVIDNGKKVKKVTTGKFSTDFNDDPYDVLKYDLEFSKK